MKLQRDGRKDVIMSKSNPIPAGKQPPNWRIIRKKFSHCHKGSRSHIRLANWDPAKGTPRETDFEGQQDLIIEFPQDWGKERLLESTNKILYTLEKEVVTSQETVSDLPVSV